MAKAQQGTDRRKRADKQHTRMQRRRPLPGELPKLHGMRQVREQASPGNQLQQRPTRAQTIAATVAGKAGDGEEKEEAPLRPKGTKLFNNNTTATRMRTPNTGKNADDLRTSTQGPAKQARLDNEYLTQAANQQDNKGKEAAGPDKGTTRDGQTEEGRQTTRTEHTQTRIERIRKSETERGITEMRPRQKGPEKHETDMHLGRDRAGHN